MQLETGQNSQVRYEDLAYESNRIIMKEKESMEKEIRSYRVQCAELEKKNEQLEADYQKRIDELNEFNKKVIDDLTLTSKNQNEITMEI